MINKKIIFILLFINVYFVVNLFLGKNNIFNFLSFKKQIVKLEEEQKSLLLQRYKIEKLYSFLSSPDQKDNNDILDELIRQTTQSSLPDEKIVLLNNEDNK